MVDRLLDGEELLVCEEDTLLSLYSDPTLELTESLQTYALVVVAQIFKMCTL